MLSFLVVPCEESADENGHDYDEDEVGVSIPQPQVIRFRSFFALSVCTIIRRGLLDLLHLFHVYTGIYIIQNTMVVGGLNWPLGKKMKNAVLCRIVPTDSVPDTDKFCL